MNLILFYQICLQVTHLECGLHYKEYASLGGTLLSRKELVQKLVAEYKNDILLLSSPGIANIIFFKSKANTVLRIQSLDDEDEGNLHSTAKKLFQKFRTLSIIKMNIKAILI